MFKKTAVENNAVLEASTISLAELEEQVELSEQKDVNEGDESVSQNSEC
jgi:hypothetical protein